MLAVAKSTLDEILATQITIAWAGETGEPRRLGWWNSDVVDRDAGGDLFLRLLPRTGRWASLATVREVARRSDAAARAVLADGDDVRSLFALGFALDERLEDRLRELKRTQAPHDALPWPVDLERYQLEDLRAAFRHGPHGAPEYDLVAGGRAIRGFAPDGPELLVKHLAATLFATDPMPDRYPLAFYRVRV